MPSKAVVPVVLSFLIAISIYSSVANFDVLALFKVTHCQNLGLLWVVSLHGYAYVQHCCEPNVVYPDVTNCQDCYYASPDYTAIVSCDPPYNPGRTAVNATGLPNPVGNALPPSGNSTGTPPFGGIIKVPVNPTNAIPPANNNTNPLPPGSIFKVPPGTVGSATNPSPINNNAGNPIAITSSDNPPGCSKKVPIPPNCTLNPFNNSVSNKAGTIGSATNPSNSTGTPPPVSVPLGTINPAGNAMNSSNNTVGTPPPPPAGQGCGPGTDNSTCSTTSNPQSTPTPPTAQTTCPDGSQPDSSGKCPTSNPNTSGPPPSSSNNNPPANNAPPSGGSSNGGGSGSSNNNNNGGGSSSPGTSSPSK